MRLNHRVAVCLLGVVLTVLASASSVFALGPNIDANLSAADGVVGEISNFRVFADSRLAGDTTDYSFKFVFEIDSLSIGTRIEIDFPVGPDLSQISSIACEDGDSLLPDFSVAEFTVVNNHLSIRLDSLEFLPPPGTEFTVLVHSIVNPTTVGDYEFGLYLLTADSELLALPKLSESLIIDPGPLASFKLSPKGIQQVRAGTTFHFDISTKDRFGNVVPVAPANIFWGMIGVPALTGVVENGSFQAQKTGASRIFASYQSFSDTSGLVYVLPGAFAYFGFSGGVDTVVAGASWQNGNDDVVITTYDLFGNINYEFTGQIYFSASDPLAVLPFTQANPFVFSAIDQGVKIIQGSQFRFFTAGRQSLSLMMGGQVQKSIFPISVLPAAVNSYNVEVASSTIAGDDLGIVVNGAVDQWNNAVAGIATISLAGGGIAPSGALPSVPSFAVNNGSGSGTLKLVKAGSQGLTVNLGGKLVQRTVNVSAAPAYRFKFDLDAVQAVNRAFFGTAMLTALDPYDNVDTDFSAAADTVRITSNGSGVVLNGVIGSATAFSFGICDLKDFNTGYNGNEPYVTFTARSKSGITGISPTIGFSLLKISAGQLAQSTRYIGEQYTFKLTISNFGSQTASISAIRLYGNGSRLQPLQISPALTFNIPALSSQEFQLTGAVPSLPNQVLTLDAVFSGQISSGTVTDSATGLAQLTILPTDGVSVLPATLLPQQVSTGRGYQFVVRVRNDSDDDLLLTSSSILTIPFAGSTPLVASLTSPLVVQGDGGEVLLPFAPVTIPDVAAQSISLATVRLVGTLGTANFDQTFSAGTTIRVETPPVISYKQGTLAPSTVYRGAEAVFSLGVKNAGSATFDIEVAAAEFTIFAGDRQLLTKLAAPEFRLASGDTTLVFNPVFVPVDFPLQNDSLLLSLRGTANGHEEEFRVVIPGNAVAIPFGAAVRLVGFVDTAPNAPYVNVGQSFQLRATVRNTGDEDLVGIKIQLSSNGTSIFTAQQTIAELQIGKDTTISFDVEASFTPNASEVFAVQILEAQGKLSELAALIQPPLSNSNRAIVIQSPASLNLDARIWAPPAAQDGVVGLGDSFALTAIVNNLAQSAATGGEVTLTVAKGNFVLTSSATQPLVIGERNFWDVMAPADEDTGLFVLEMSETPIDANSGLLAKVQDRVDTIEVISTVSQVGISVDFEPAPAQLLSAGGEYEVLTLQFRIFNQAANPYMNYIKFEIRDRANNPVAPGSLIASASLRYNDQTNTTATVDGDALRFNIGEAQGIPSSGKINVQLVDQPSMSDFVLYLDSLSFSASYQTAVGPRPVPITASFAQKLVIQQNFTLVPQTLTESFFAFPNPFSPLHEQSTIVYNLSSAKAATLKIYTLTGEQVLSREIAAPASISEPVQILWDGRNTDGRIVLNGVYIAVLAVDGEAEVRTKIAVVK